MAEHRTGKSTFIRSDYIIIIGSIITVILAGLTRYLAKGSILAFVCSFAAVALLASLVGRSIEQLGDRLGAGATGALHSALGNLPELFISLFALKEGLVEVVQAAVIGSVIANLLLVMGLCFLVGGIKYGTQNLGTRRAQTNIVFMVLSVAALILPSVAMYVHTPAAPHEQILSTIVAVILLVLFILIFPAFIKRKGSQKKDSSGGREQQEPPRWPFTLAIIILVASGVGAAFVSDWFVNALEPTMHALNISDAFSGLVIIAIAGNAIENVVGIQLAVKNRSEYAFSVVVNSPLQITLVLAPLLVILSQVFGYTPFTLVFPPMLVIAIAFTVILTAFITFDGKSNWIEGAALIAVYAIIASSFWWG